MGIASAIDHRPVEFTIEEQALLRSYRIAARERFEFLVRPAPAEGSFVAPLRAMSIAGLDGGLYVNEALVAQARGMLSRRDGIPISEVLSAIDLRLASKAVSAIRTRLPEVQAPGITAVLANGQEAATE
jgi:predicted ABC-class ATPase